MDNKVNYKIKSVALAQTPKEIFKYNVRGRGNHILYGANDLYPQDLTRMLNESPTANRLINYRVGLLNQAGTTGNELLAKIFKNVSDDFTTYGGYAIKIGWSRDRENIVMMEHIPFADYRAGKFDTTGEIKYCELNADWTCYKDFPIINYQTFDPMNVNDSFVQIYVYTRYTKGMKIYPLPFYFAAQDYIELEGELANYRLNNVKGGFTPTTVITLPTANMSEEEEQALYDGLKESAVGRDGNRFIVLYGDGANTPTITTLAGLDTNAAKELDEIVTQKILTAFGLNSPMLAGLPGSGGLGGNASELEAATAYFYKENIIPDINELEQSFKTILPYCKDDTFTINKITYNATQPE